MPRDPTRYLAADERWQPDWRLGCALGRPRSALRGGETVGGTAEPRHTVWGPGADSQIGHSPVSELNYYGLKQRSRKLAVVSGSCSLEESAGSPVRGGLAATQTSEAPPGHQLRHRIAVP